MAAELAGEMGRVGFAVVDPTVVVIARRETVSLLDREVKGGQDSRAHQQRGGQCQSKGAGSNEEKHRPTE